MYVLFCAMRKKSNFHLGTNEQVKYYHFNSFFSGINVRLGKLIASKYYNGFFGLIFEIKMHFQTQSTNENIVLICLVSKGVRKFKLKEVC